MQRPQRSSARPKPRPAAGAARARARAEAELSPGGTALRQVLARVSLDADPIIEGAALRNANIGAFWTWFARDVAPDDASALDAAVAADPGNRAQFVGAAAERIVNASKMAVDRAADSSAGRRLVIQLGGEEEFAALPAILNCLANLRLLDKAAEFARAVNAMTDAQHVAAALKAMQLPDQALRQLWFTAAATAISDPRRFLVSAVIASGRESIEAVREAGFAACFEAMLIDAQRQALILSDRAGLFADVDLACRAAGRFHAIARAIRYCFELPRTSRWAFALSQLTRQVSAAMDPLLSDVTSDVVQALRPPRDGADRLSEDAVLQALNALYLLAAARDSRESLALNTTVDRVWGEVGMAMEGLLTRALEAYRRSPDDAIAGRRLDAAVKMAAIRFGPEYARSITMSREAIDRQIGQAPAPGSEDAGEREGESVVAEAAHQ